jgi:quinol monooxygenase YgiN
MEPVHVVAVIEAKPGKRAELLAAFQANVPAVHAEDGCIEYAATVDTEGAGPIQTPFGLDTFVVVEKWGEPRGLAGACRGPAHEGLWRAREGPDRRPHDPRPLAGLTQPPTGQKKHAPPGQSRLITNANAYPVASGAYNIL